ncbi:MAG: Nif3-like dinuclear metal center hexameric protein [Christensenellaceae bacterium]|jgi:dinuclear metal center YbgI/SA1388 family protein|nr:Nif3-like dinuclear metal center hexameric protein [Christensenellaceae bacterium]
MKVSDFVALQEAIAPPGLALSFDNPGLLLGTQKRDIRKVLVALDCSVATAREAIDWEADLMLVHHPVFFEGVKHILPEDPATAAPYLLLRHGIALYAAHTNMDAAQGGVNDCLAGALGLYDTALLPPENLGRIGSIAPTTLGAFAAKVQSALHTTVRVGGAFDKPVTRVSVLGGAGGEDIYAAHAAGADAFVTGEIKHHLALAAGVLGLGIIEAGHYETERVVLQPWITRLQQSTDDVQYRLSLCETACLRGL